MKKRLLSTFLALAMVFSVVPVNTAVYAVLDNNSVADSYEATSSSTAEDSIGNLFDSLNVNISNGTITSITGTINDAVEVAPMALLVMPDIKFVLAMDDGEGGTTAEIIAMSDIVDAEAVKTSATVGSDSDDFTIAASLGETAWAKYPYFFYYAQPSSASFTIDPSTEAFTDLDIASRADIFKSTTIDAALAAAIEEKETEEGFISIRLLKSAEDIEDSSTYVYANNAADLGDVDYTVVAYVSNATPNAAMLTSHIPVNGTYTQNFPGPAFLDMSNVRYLTATLTAPSVKTAPATTVTGITVDGTTATASAVTWSANATSANGYPAAGTGTYTATFDITAPEGVTFTEGQAFSITIDGATSARAVYKDAHTATVTAVFPAITKTPESISATAPTTSVEVGDSYNVKYAPITITYNDGTTLAVDANSASYASRGITVDTSALTGGEQGKTSLTIAGADKGKTLNVTALLGALSAVIEKVKVTENAPPATGTSVYAVYDNGTLTFKYDDPKEETGTVYNNILSLNQASAADLPWYANRSSITKVVFDRSFGYAYPTNTSYWFADCASLETIEGIGHLVTKDTTNMSNMFAGCEKLTAPDLSTLDTSKVTDMSGMFKDCKALTSLDVSTLDTSKVTNMSQMFAGCTGIAELDVSEWDTTALTDTTEMFKGCTALKTIYADESADWTGITSGTDMFDGCSALKGGNGTAYSADHKDKSYAIVDSKTKTGYFTATKMVSGTYAVYDGDKTFTFKYSEKPVRERGTIFDAANTTTNEPWLGINSKVENVIFEDSFADARPKSTMWWFNGFTNLTSIEGIENLNTSAVTDMGYMFRDCAKLENLDVTHFDTSKVTNMDEMFAGCTKLKALDVSGFDISSATTIHKMFKDCPALTSIDVSGFNTAKVTGMSYMFENCVGIKELNIANWDVSKVTNANGIFSGCSNLERLIASTDTDWSGINNGDNMFTGCTKLKGGAGTEYAAANKGKAYAVTDGYNNKKGYFTGTWAGQGAYAVYDGSKTLTFKYSDKEVREFGIVYPVENTPTDPDAIPWKEHKGKITDVVFEPYFSAARPKSTANWFNGMTNLNAITDMQKYLNTSDTTNMSGMFVGCKNPATVNLSNFDTAKVTDMSRMFEGCTGIQVLNFSKFNTSNVTNMSQMFSNCSALKTIDLSKFNTSKVTDMSAMFNGCSTLTTLDVSKLDTSKVTNMTNMFKNCSKLETIDAGEVADWKTSLVSESNDMFTGCTQLKGVYEYNSSNTDVNMANTTKGYFKPLPPEKPTITGIDGEMTGVYGEGTTITADATAPTGHSLLYQWYTNTTESNAGGTAITGATSASYEIGGTVPVGTHYYYCVVTAKRDDNGLTDTATSDAAAVTITKATPDVDAPENITATYGQTLADVTLPEGWAWVDASTTSVGTAGEHTFSATYTDEDTHNYVPVTKEVTVTVGKAAPAFTAPTDITATYGQTLEDVTLPSHWEWKDSTESVGNVGDNEFTAVYTPDDTDNYNTAETKITVTVGKADQAAPELPTAAEKTYSSITIEPVTGGVNGVEYAISTTEEEPDGDAWTDNATFTDLATNTTYYVYARYKGDDSHNVSPSSHAAIKTNEHIHNWGYAADGATITATCKNTDHACPNTAGGTITIAAPANTEYDDQPHEAVVTNNLTTGADVQVKYEYKSWGADTFAEINDLPINSGMYKASITLDDATVSVTYSINVTQQTPEPAPTDNPGAEKLYTVGGGTVGSGIPVVPVTNVKLRIDSLDKEVVSGAYGLFQFDNLPEGKYTLTITYTDSSSVERTKDQVFEVTGNDMNRVIVVPDKNVSSSVDIDESLEDVYVDQLDDVAEDLAKDDADDADVKIKLSVESEDEDETSEAQNEIRKLAGDESDHMDYIDIKVTKTVGDGEAEVVDESDKTVRILIPFDNDKQYSVRVYRYDTNTSGEAKAVSLSTNKKDSEYYEITDDGYIAIVTNKFTTFAIGYDDEPAPTPTPIVIRRGGGGGGGGGSSTKATPTPDPSVTPEPTDTEPTPSPEPTETPEPYKEEWWFIDVPKIEWFYPPIYYSYYNDLMYGTSEDTFEPYLDITRAMFVTVLYRIDGSPDVPIDYTFEDIDKDSYYEKAVAWGSANDIIAGYSAEEYAPHDTITREQMAAILWRYAQYKGTDVSVGDETSIDDFIDADETTEYAIPALKWAYGDHILSGFEDNTLRPLSFATRAQASVVLSEYNKKIKE